MTAYPTRPRAFSAQGGPCRSYVTADRAKPGKHALPTDAPPPSPRCPGAILDSSPDGTGLGIWLLVFTADGRVAISRDAFEDDVPRRQVRTGRTVGECPGIRPTGLRSLCGCVLPPGGISASWRRQCEPEQVFNLSEREHHPVGVSRDEVFVEELILPRRDHVAPYFAKSRTASGNSVSAFVSRRAVQSGTQA